MGSEVEHTLGLCVANAVSIELQSERSMRRVRAEPMKPADSMTTYLILIDLNSKAPKACACICYILLQKGGLDVDEDTPRFQRAQ